MRLLLRPIIFSRILMARGVALKLTKELFFVEAYAISAQDIKLPTFNVSGGQSVRDMVIQRPHLSWIRGFLTDPTFYFKFDSSLQSSTTAPFDSVVGPSLLVVYATNLPSDLNTAHLCIADDVKLLASAASTRARSTNWELILNRIISLFPLWWGLPRRRSF